MSISFAHPNASVVWLEKRDAMKQLHSIPNEVEKELDGILTISQWLQFDRDVRIYGLYEAVILIRPENMIAEVQTAIGNLYNWFAKEPSRPLPLGKALNETGELEGKPVAQIRVPITPSVTWRVRVDEIRHLQSRVWDTNGEGTKSWLDRHLSQCLRGQMHVVADVLAACKIDLYSGVDKIPPIQREGVKARILKHLCIEDAVDSYVNNRYLQPKADVAPRVDKVFYTDCAGNAWVWNCGWYRIGEDGNRLDSKSPLGHAKFRRAIKLASPEELGKTSFRYTRPWGMWRRASGRFAHDQFGNVELLHTDGVHAVVRKPDGTKCEVHFSNLEAIGQAVIRRQKDRVSTAQGGTPRERKTTLSPEFLAKLDKILEDF
jgi:hypothetical protein